MENSLSGKVAYVTGGSLGIGAGVCRLLAARGVSVVIGYGNSRDAAEWLAEEIRAAGGKAATSGGDIRMRETARAGVATALERFGGLDILVVAAGISGRETLEEITEERYRALYDTNVLGTIFAVQAAVAHLASPGGRIVMITSRVALNPVPGSSLYAGTKAAMHAMTETYAKELGGRGITVNAVAPGLIDSERMHAAVVSRGDAVAAETPLARIGMPEDVARVVAFLASQDSGWVTGRTIRADGGIV